MQLITTSLELHCMNYFGGKKRFFVCFNKVIKPLYGLIVEIRTSATYRRKGCLEDLRFLNFKKKLVVCKMITILFNIFKIIFEMFLRQVLS